jgi:hypothetical protein
MNVEQKFATEEYINSMDIDDRIAGLEGSDLLTYEEHGELQNLKKFKDEAVELFGEMEWVYGLNFIRDDYFSEHARELAEDMGVKFTTELWPYNHIDWHAASDELKYDYSQMDPLFGAIYWVRG